MVIVNFEAFLIAITLLTLTPGLDTALVIRNASRSGFHDGCMTSLGVCFGLFVHATFSAIGISAILLQSADLFQWIKWLGAAYLIYLGLMSFKGVVQGQKTVLPLAAKQQGSNHYRALREGFLSNILNPKTAIFYLAFLPQFINPEYSAFKQSLLMAGIHFVIAMLWQCALAGAVNRAKMALANPRVMQVMEAVMGCVMVSLGIKLLSSKN